jgi:hypothetical protein
VQFEEGRELARAARLAAAVADGVECVKATPPRSWRAAAQARWNTPAKVPEASIAGVKREPSSLVQLTTSIGAKVS